MKIKRFFAKDMRTALKEVKEELGVVTIEEVTKTDFSDSNHQWRNA